MNLKLTSLFCLLFAMAILLQDHTAEGKRRPNRHTKSFECGNCDTNSTTGEKLDPNCVETNVCIGIFVGGGVAFVLLAIWIFFCLSNRVLVKFR